MQIEAIITVQIQQSINPYFRVNPNVTMVVTANKAP